METAYTESREFQPESSITCHVITGGSVGLPPDYVVMCLALRFQRIMTARLLPWHWALLGLRGIDVYYFMAYDLD